MNHKKQQLHFGLGFVTILMVLFGCFSSANAQVSATVRENRYLNDTGNAAESQPGILDIFTFELAPKALQTVSGFAGLGSTSIFGSSNPIIFRQVGTSIFDDVVAYSNAAIKTLFVGYDNSPTFTTGDPLLQVDGTVQIKELAHTDPSGYMQACINDFGHIKICSALVRVFQKTDITSMDGFKIYSSTLGDFDGDGDIDIFAGHYNSSSRLWKNNGSGVFTAGSVPSGIGTAVPYDVASGDVDGDGDLDVYLGQYSTGTPNNLLINDGSGNFTVTTISGDIARTRAVDMSDYDNDGDLDIYVANLAGANKLYLNNGSGSFTPKSTPDATNRPGGVVFGDLDNDGDLDGYATVLGDDLQNKILVNDGAANFTIQTISGDLYHSQQPTLVDVDNDGDLDIYVPQNSTVTEPNKLWINQTSSGFGPSTMSFTDGSLPSDSYSDSISASFADLDGDGNVDMYMPTNAWGSLNRLRYGNGDGTFNETLLTSDNISSYISEIADFDGNGFLDIFTLSVNSNGSSAIFFQVEEYE